MGKHTNLLLLEGFLGSGKTTLMLELGRRLARRGIKAGYVTNDQGAYLVDTAFAKTQTDATEEVTGSCFCCNFPALIENIRTLRDFHKPDVIIAEAVGSCTDLAATVVLPLQERYGEEFSIAGYYVLVDGGRLLDEYSLRMNLVDPRSPAEILVSHQIREAETLLISKSDFLDEEDLRSGTDLLRRINPHARVLACSSHDGDGIETLVDDLLGARRVEIGATIPLDYTTYAKAEAELGWYNGQWSEEVSPGNWETFLRELQNRLLDGIAHAKVFVRGKDHSLKLSLAGGRIERDGISPETGPYHITLNVRARTTPDHIRTTVEELISTRNAESYLFEALVPAPPNPTHRIERSGTT